MTPTSLQGMASRVVTPEDFEWRTRPHDPGEPARHGAELSGRDEDLLVYAYGTPPENEHAAILDSAV